MGFFGKLRTGLQNPFRTGFYLSSYLGVAASSRGYLGRNAYTSEWDVLILLDTCRVDALRAVADEYSFLTTVDSVRSVGASSPEWIAATFDRRRIGEIRETVYLASNGYAQVILEDGGAVGDSTPEELDVALPKQFDWAGADWDFARAEDLKRLEHIWRYEPKDSRGELGHVEGHSPPRYVTGRAIDVAREEDPGRLILHYNQPHSPYTANAIEEDRSLTDLERDPFDYIRRTGDRESVFEAYLDELRYVLDDVELLLENMDAETVVISADHGEAFGEYGYYGHPVGSLHPKVRRVPWAETTATDEGTYTPQFEPPETADRSVAETLEALGYKT